MREYCPLCEKNGVKSKIGCYQINWEEAVFMCPSIECPWPMEMEDSLIIKRPIKKYKTNAALEEVTNKYFKKEDDLSNGFLSAYTPPQTPEVYLKDTASGQVPWSGTVPECTFTSLDAVEDTVFNTDNILVDVSKLDAAGTDNPQITITVNTIKPKLVKIEKMPAKSHVFKDSSDLYSKTNVQLESKKQNVCTQLVDSSAVVKTEQCDSRMLVHKANPKLRKFTKFKSKTPLQKFTFEGYKKKSESTKDKISSNLTLGNDVIKSDNNVSTVKMLDKLDGNETVNTIENIVSKANLLNSSSPVVKPVDSPTILPDVKDCENDIDIDFAEFFSDSNVNLNTNENLDKNDSEAVNQLDIDSILNSLTNNSNNLSMEQSELDDLGDYFESLSDFSL